MAGFRNRVRRERYGVFCQQPRGHGLHRFGHGRLHESHEGELWPGLRIDLPRDGQLRDQFAFRTAAAALGPEQHAGRRRRLHQIHRRGEVDSHHRRAHPPGSHGGVRGNGGDAERSRGEGGPDRRKAGVAGGGGAGRGDILCVDPPTQPGRLRCQDADRQGTSGGRSLCAVSESRRGIRHRLRDDDRQASAGTEQPAGGDCQHHARFLGAEDGRGRHGGDRQEETAEITRTRNLRSSRRPGVIAGGPPPGPPFRAGLAAHGNKPRGTRVSCSEAGA